MFYQNGFCNKYSVKTGRTRFTTTDTDFIIIVAFSFSIREILHVQKYAICRK